jgi:hypothetical protein
MAAIANTPINKRNSLIRSIALGGIIIGTLHITIQHFLFYTVLGKAPFISVMQYIASGAMGNAAFAGGLATALLGVFFHYLISFVVAGVFIVSAARIPLLRRNVIVGSLLYGIAAFFVLNNIVVPLSAAPELVRPPFEIIELIVEHALLIGLPLGLLIRSNANADM